MMAMCMYVKLYCVFTEKNNYGKVNFRKLYVRA